VSAEKADKILSSRYVLQADILLKLAERSGQKMPSVMYMTAPVIQKIAIQSRILGTSNHPLMKWLIKQGYSLRTNMMLHEIADPVLVGSLLSTVTSAVEKQQELIKRKNGEQNGE